MSELGRFQDAFVEAVRGAAPDPLADWLDDPVAAEAGLAVYRNTIAKGCVEALAANFPTVNRLVGETWFAAAAALFARETPPTRAALLAYGAGFPEWLGRFPPAADLPYLPGVATLDGLWTAALFAAEGPVLGPADFAALPGEALAAARVALHPSLAIAWFDNGLPGLWLAARQPDAAELALAPDPEGALIVRPDGAVHARAIDAATHAFLRACRAGLTLGEAMAEAVAVAPRADLVTLFAALIGDGAFSALIPGETR